MGLGSLCPAIFSACEWICVAVISDNMLKFKNLTHLTLHPDFAGADINTIKQLSAHSLTSLAMSISTQEHIEFLSDALVHLQQLKELHLTQIHTEDVWNDVAVSLRNAPCSLNFLCYLQSEWDGDDDMRIRITPGMFSSRLTQSIEKLELQCHVGDLTGLSEFCHLKSLQLSHLDVADLYTLYSRVLCHTLSLTELGLRWEDDEGDAAKPFTSILSTLIAIVNGLPKLQSLDVSISTSHLDITDDAMAKIFSDIAQSEVELHWAMDDDDGWVSFSPYMYRSFLTVLFHPKLRHLVENFYQDDKLS